MIQAKALLFSADVTLAHSITTSLNEAGYKVVHLLDGVRALELIHAEKPCVVILDKALPGYNSLAIIRSIRAEEINNHMPIILLGADIHAEDVLIGLEVGADLCLTETFHPQVFVARVRSLVRRSEPAIVH